MAGPCSHRLILHCIVLLPYCYLLEQHTKLSFIKKKKFQEINQPTNQPKQRERERHHIQKFFKNYQIGQVNVIKFLINCMMHALIVSYSAFIFYHSSLSLSHSGVFCLCVCVCARLVNHAFIYVRSHVCLLVHLCLPVSMLIFMNTRMYE